MKGWKTKKYHIKWIIQSNLEQQLLFNSHLLTKLKEKNYKPLVFCIVLSSYVIK